VKWPQDEVDVLAGAVVPPAFVIRGALHLSLCRSTSKRNAGSIARKSCLPLCEMRIASPGHAHEFWPSSVRKIVVCVCGRMGRFRSANGRLTYGPSGLLSTLRAKSGERR
jgi:hypothetical protein